MERLKGFLKEAALFLTSAIFLKNFAGMLGVVVGFVLLSNWFLGCYTRHGESVQVDDFIGMSMEDAERQARDKDFKFVVIDSSQYKLGQPSGIILKQEPEPLQRVKEGRTIYVTVTGGPKAYRLPDFKLSEYDYDRYAKRLANASIRTRIKERVFDKKQANNSILYFFHEGKKISEREVSAGFYVMPGDELEFVVTEQLSNELMVPDLVCMNFSAAEFLVSSHNLIIGTINDDGAISSQADAYVVQQDPPAGQPIQMGGQLTIWLSQEKPSTCTDGNDADPSDGTQDDGNW